MIPLRDNVPRVTMPIAVVTVIVLNVLLFLYSQGMTLREQAQLFHLYGLVPARFLEPDWAIWAGYPASRGWPFLTYMFLHGGWVHIILNMWMLWIFGDNIEDVTGHFGFIVFYVICGIAAVVLHMAFSQTSGIPVIGASGAVAGVMGAYIILYPHGRVLTLVPIIIIPIILRVPSYLFLGIWFLSQITSGFLSNGTKGAHEVAWWAHVGGFIAGMVLIMWFRKRSECRYCYNPLTKDYDPEKGNPLNSDDQDYPTQNGE